MTIDRKATKLFINNFTSINAKEGGHFGPHKLPSSFELNFMVKFHHNFESRTTLNICVTSFAT